MSEKMNEQDMNGRRGEKEGRMLMINGGVKA